MYPVAFLPHILRVKGYEGFQGIVDRRQIFLSASLLAPSLRVCIVGTYDGV